MEENEKFWSRRWISKGMQIFSIFFSFPSWFMTSVYPAGQLSNLLLRIWGFPGIPITSNEFDLPNSIHTCQPINRDGGRTLAIIQLSLGLIQFAKQHKREKADLAQRQQTARDLIGGRIKETWAGLFLTSAVRKLNFVCGKTGKCTCAVGVASSLDAPGQIHPTGLKS